MLVGLEVPCHLTNYELRITEDVQVLGSELSTKLNFCDKSFVFSDVVGGFEFKPEGILIRVTLWVRDYDSCSAESVVRGSINLEFPDGVPSGGVWVGTAVGQGDKFSNKVCSCLPFDGHSQLVVQVKFSQLNRPFYYAA